MKLKALLLALILFGIFISSAIALRPATDKVSIIVRFKDKIDTETIAKANGQILKTYKSIPALAAHVDAASVDVLRTNPNIAYVETDKERRIQGRLNEVQAKPGSVQPPQTLPWGVDRIDADRVWHRNEGEGTNIAIIDTGVDPDHPDLIGNIEGVFSAVPPKADTVDDHYGHGTHVAGTIAAVNNEIGVIGVGPRIDLWIIKASAGGILQLKDLLESYDFVINTWFDSDLNNNIQVVSMSYGGGYSQAEDEMLHEAWDMGIILVAAAGNEGGAVIYPAALPFVIAVSAMNMTDQITSWSNRGPEIDLAAPGSRITSTYLRGQYATWSGTSMATPHVSASAALALAAHPEMTSSEIVQLMFDEAEDLGDPGLDIMFGHGLVDAEAVGK
ncbi:MAG TPA: S8 family serine peptidase [Candidatus Bathyarchaeia archaeon]|nr:S8 family serine peptidase [Candidatus Bathyarchaeia archaeon]